MEREEEMYVEKEVHLRDYFRILRKRKYTVFTFFLIVFALVVLYTYTTIPLYTATSRIMIEEGEKTPLLTSYGYIQYNPEFIQTQVQIIKSTPVAKKVVHQLNLVDTYDSFFEEIKDRITIGSMAKAVTDWGKNLYATAFRLIGVVQADYIPEEQEAAKDDLPKDERIATVVTGGINIEPMKESRIIDISYTSPNPELARQIVNAIVKAYIEKTLEMKMESSGYTIKWMTQKADEERARLRQSEAVLQEYMKAQNIVTMENRLAITPQKIGELNSQLTRAETRRKELEAIYEKVKAVNGNYNAAESIDRIASDPAIQALRNRILEAEKQVNDYSKKYGPKHPVMKKALAELEMLQGKRKQEIERVVSIIKNEYELVRSTEKNLAELLAKTKSEAIGLNEKLIQFNLLKQEVETNRQMYEALVTKLKEQAVSEQAQSVKVWVVEEAKRPELPSKPRKSRNVMLGLVLGLFGGIGIAFFLEYLDNTVKYPDDVQERYGLPVLSTVPYVKNQKGQPEVLTLEEPSGAFAESYKSIRAAVMLSGSGKPPKSLLITSMSPEDGKTTTAVNLAAVFAQAGKKTLLVDADMRKPRIHKIFKLENGAGLSSYLAGAAELKISPVESIDNLFVLKAGPAPPNPSELLGSDRFRRFLEDSGRVFDVMVFDSPPVLTVSDSLVLSKALDGTLIVARAGKVTFEIIEKGLSVLGNIQAPIIGFILNAILVRKGDYYYYHHYYHSYYTSEKKKAT